MPKPKRLSVEAYCAGIEQGSRMILAKAITLIESQRPSDQQLARQVIQRLLPKTGGAVRLGITGVPGVGKSTLLDALGVQLIEQGHRVAVLAIDPSSTLSGGSILGDKTRMVRLAADDRAFIRPSPSDTELGGVARKTRETILLCEAAGYDVVIVETVGVGQSEVMVANMVDTFVALMLPGAGDELQGIKKGLLEMADLIVINKCDGENQSKAQQAKREYRAALHYLPQRHACWKAMVLMVSGLKQTGLEELWTEILNHRSTLQQAGELEQLRSAQQRDWMWAMLRQRLLQSFRTNPQVEQILPDLERQVFSGTKSASLAVDELIRLFEGIESI